MRIVAKSVDLIVRIVVFLEIFANAESDPSAKELEMFDWSGGLRVVFCNDRIIPEIMTPFREAMSKVATKYCANITACNINRTTIFQPVHIAYVDEYPRWDVRELVIKFGIVIPITAGMRTPQKRAMLTRATVTDMLRKHEHEIESRLNVRVRSIDRYKFDAMTEFMNIAIIPIIIFSIPLMVFLAYWTSTLRPNMGNESWLVTGSSGGKNAALRRTMEIIAEQNEEIRRQEMSDKLRNLKITGAHEGLSGPAQLLLNVARLSIASSSFTAGLSQQAPIVAVPTVSRKSSAASTQAPPSSPPSPTGQQPATSMLQLRDANPHFRSSRKDRRNSRRQSSVEGLQEKRRNRGISSASVPGAPRWKSGSLVLSRGFRK